jgi:hypothetical protein
MATVANKLFKLSLSCSTLFPWHFELLFPLDDELEQRILSPGTKATRGGARMKFLVGLIFKELFFVIES